MSATRSSHSRSWWQAHLQRIEQEGIGTKAYAQREGLSARQLYDKRKEFKLRAAREQTVSGSVRFGGQFVPVKVVPEATPASARHGTICTVVLLGGIRMEMASLPDPAWLAALSANLLQTRR